MKKKPFTILLSAFLSLGVVNLYAQAFNIGFKAGVYSTNAYYNAGRYKGMKGNPNIGWDFGVFATRRILPHFSIVLEPVLASRATQARYSVKDTIPGVTIDVKTNFRYTDILLPVLVKYSRTESQLNTYYFIGMQAERALSLYARDFLTYSNGNRLVHRLNGTVLEKWRIGYLLGIGRGFRVSNHPINIDARVQFGRINLKRSDDFELMVFGVGIAYGLLALK